jgi:hypothetical protein
MTSIQLYILSLGDALWYNRQSKPSSSKWVSSLQFFRLNLCICHLSHPYISPAYLIHLYFIILIKRTKHSSKPLWHFLSLWCKCILHSTLPSNLNRIRYFFNLRDQVPLPYKKGNSNNHYYTFKTVLKDIMHNRRNKATGTVRQAKDFL